MSKRGLLKGASRYSIKKEVILDPRCPWEKDLENFDITKDMDFKCYVAFFMESTTEFYGLLELFNEEASDGKRWEIKVVTLDHIRNTVLDNCTKSRPKKPFNLLCDQILRHAGYDFKGKIPPNLLGYFIKYEIRRLKIMYKEYLDYQKECEDHKLEKQKIIYSMSNKEEDELKMNESMKTSEPRTPTLASKIKSTKSQPVSSTYGKRRAQSELTRRGEEKRGKIYVKDSPIDGPQVYLVITLVYQQLPAELIEKFDIPVVCIIKVGNDQLLNSLKESSEKTVYEKLLEINDEYYKSKGCKYKFSQVLSQKHKEKEINTFWLEFNTKIQQPGNSLYYERTILGQYTPPLDKLDFRNITWREELKTKIYDDFTRTLYNVHKINELYNRYNSTENIKINVPQEATGEFSSDIYREILDEIPSKCINVPIIFNAMLTQVDVSHTTAASVRPQSTELETLLINPMEIKRESLLENKFEKLNYLYDIHEEEENSSVRNKLANVKELLSDKVEIKYAYDRNCFKIFRKLAQVPNAFFEEEFNSIKLSGKIKKTYKNFLASFRKALGIREHKLLSEMLLVLKTIDNNYRKLKLESTAKQNNSKEEENESIIEENFSPNKADTRPTTISLNSLENMSSNTLIKKLFDLHLSHNTYERIYIPLLNSILYTFYNRPINKIRTVAMQTPLGLKDFFKYILPKEHKWAQQVTYNKSDEGNPNLTHSKLCTLEIPEPLLSPIEITPKLTIDERIFAMEGEGDTNNETEEVIRYLEETEFPDTFVTHRKNVKRHLIIKKEESREMTTSKSFTKIESADLSEQTLRQPKEVYDFGRAQRIQFTCRNIEAIFRHGTKLKIQYRHKHYGKKTMHLEVDICGHRLYYTSNIHINGEKSKVLLMHKSGIIFNFNEHRKEIIQTEREINMPSKLVTYYTATICSPSEYVIEFKYLDEENVYMKHSYLENSKMKKVENEYFRIYLRNNCLIRFLTNGTQEILFSSGKKIICFVNESPTNDEESEDFHTGVKNYDILYGCGKICSFINGEKSTEEKQMQLQVTTFYTGNFQLIEHKNGTVIQINGDGSQIVQFKDGTKFVTEVICVEECPKESGVSFLENDYVHVYLKVTCEHKNFATTIYNEKSNTTEIKLQSDIEVVLTGDNTYTVEMGKSSVLHVKEEIVILDKCINNSLFQRSQILPNVLKYHRIPNPPLTHFLTRDIYGNELAIDTQSQIHYKYSISTENAFFLKYAVSNKKHILMRRDLSGFEAFPNHLLTLLKNKSENKEGMLIQNKWNMPFINTTLLFPKKINQHEKGISSLFPSTYGKTKFFPFFITDNKNKNNHKYELQEIKTLVCDDYINKYEDTAQKSKKLMRKEIRIVNCKCIKSKHQVQNTVKLILKCQEQHTKENILIKSPNSNFMLYLKDAILHNALKKADENVLKPDKLNKFTMKRNEILQRKIPPFFESAFGIAYFITKDVENSVNSFIEKIEL